MTLPDERIRAINQTKEFLQDLLDPKKTPKVPKSIRKRAYRCVKHFPHPHEIPIEVTLHKLFLNKRTKSK